MFRNSTCHFSNKGTHEKNLTNTDWMGGESVLCIEFWSLKLWLWMYSSTCKVWINYRNEYSGLSKDQN